MDSQAKQVNSLPIEHANWNEQRNAKRNLLASFFITLMIGISFQDMTAAVRESVRTHAFSWGDVCLLGSFFLIAVRFFIGNQLHLLSDSFVKLPGIVWLFDLVMILGQTTVLVFLGGLVSVRANMSAEVSFIDLMVILYVMDILWICSFWLIPRIDETWKREMIPWQWALLNLILVVCAVLLDLYFDDLYSVFSLSILLGLNLVAFVVDVVLVDYYDAL